MKDDFGMKNETIRLSNERHAVAGLFAGAGGLDYGFKDSGHFDVVLANEMRATASDTYSAAFGVKKVEGKYLKEDLPAVVQGDVGKLDFEKLKDVGVNVVIGGPPCQDFSMVRGPKTERKGMKVKRGRLYAYFIKSLATLQPKVFVFENVKGLTSASAGRAYSMIKSDFSNLDSEWKSIKKEIGNNSNGRGVKGYSIIFDEVVNFARLGVPQNRKRLIIMGVRDDCISGENGGIAEISNEAHKPLKGETGLIGKYPLTPMEVFEGCPLKKLQKRYEEIMEEYNGIWRDIKTSAAEEWKKYYEEELTFDVKQDYLMANGLEDGGRTEINAAFKEHKKILGDLGYDKNVRELNPEDGSNCDRRNSRNVRERMERIPPDKNYKFADGTKWKVVGKDITLIYRRLHPLKPAYTVMAHGGGGTHGYHYERNRATLTHRENARLQTFPDDFLFKGNPSDIRSQIGEAVPPLGAKRIADAVNNLLEGLQ